jgi:hypothetical protein
MSRRPQSSRNARRQSGCAPSSDHAPAEGDGVGGSGIPPEAVSQLDRRAAAGAHPVVAPRSCAIVALAVMRSHERKAIPEWVGLQNAELDAS